MIPMNTCKLTLFDPNGKKSIAEQNDITLTIGRNSITIHKATFNFLGKPEFVEFGYDDKKALFGIRPANEQTNNAVKVNFNSKRATTSIDKTSVIEMIEAIKNFERKDNNLILNNPSLNAQGFYCFDLNKGTIVRRERRGNHA